MINTDKTFDGLPLSYEIFEDGYEIYLDGKLWIKQRGEYSKPIDAGKSYEENCLMQMEEVTTIFEPSNQYGILDETVQAIKDDTVAELIELGVL